MLYTSHPALEPGQSASQTRLAIRGTLERFWKGTLRLAQEQDRETPLLLRQGDSGAYFKPYGAVVLRDWFRPGITSLGKHRVAGDRGKGSPLKGHDSYSHRHQEKKILERVQCRVHLPSCPTGQCLDYVLHLSTSQ